MSEVFDTLGAHKRAQQEAQRQKDSAQKQLDLVQNFRQAFSGPPGEATLRNLIEEMNVFRPTFDKDPLVHAHNAGKREAILYIMMMVDYDVQKLIEKVGKNVQAR